MPLAITWTIFRPPIHAILDFFVFGVKPVKKENVSKASRKVAKNVASCNVNVSIYYAIHSSIKSDLWIFLNKFGCLLIIKNRILRELL